MPDLPIRRITLYKHGVGYFERRGAYTGDLLQLSFPRDAMDDVLKSLVAIDLAGGQVHGVDFDTPDDRDSRIARGSIHLSDTSSMLDLLRDLRGRTVRVASASGPLSEPAATDGLVIGIDRDDDQPLRAPLLSLYLAERRTVRTIAVASIVSIELLDASADDDLRYFLRASQREEDRRSATVHLSAGEHQLLVGYVAPAPAWRVSYRLLLEGAPDSAGETALLLQGWGLFDNQLDEDLVDVELALVAGMPISFRYRLYEPHTPERPLVEDEERTVAAPVEFAAMAAPPPASPKMAAPMLSRSAPIVGAMMEAEAMSIDALAGSTAVAGEGDDRGALFAYRVTHPVSVARGQSAMVPIIGARLKGRRELIYSGARHPVNPVATIRLSNATGLTLERGPATVVADGEYSGEAVLPFTRAGGELIVPYAIELGVTVSEVPSSERQLIGLRVGGDALIFEEWEILRRRYRVTSALSEAVTLVIEQQIASGYERFDTPDPAEEAHGAARWPVSCPPGIQTEFTVSQRVRRRRQEALRGVSQRQLQEFLRQRYLDEATFAALRDVFALYETTDANQRRLQAIETERQRIYKRQQQTQGSIQPLGRDGDEGALRQRYVAVLNECETQLAQLTDEETKIGAEQAALQRRVQAALAALAEK